MTENHWQFLWKTKGNILMFAWVQPQYILLMLMNKLTERMKIKFHRTTIS